VADIVVSGAEAGTCAAVDGPCVAGRIPILIKLEMTDWVIFGTRSSSACDLLRLLMAVT